ncbi:MAG: histidine triad nucleotide-binding protein [Rickettsiales bacterium]|nr:histidine triad nucleotide-binding protein [Rickettsiales bacterium]|tara:strand:- start:23770 stop:24102 length:333 start_codon:yes stop_codon:yes gene_type:complete
MYVGETIFSKIIDGTLPANKVYEDEHVLAFHDINPQAKTHVLVIPKKKYISFDDFIQEADEREICAFYKAVQKIAADLGLAKTGYKLVSNHGADAGQEVFHYHVHLLGSV